jgi:hypothetical protein
MADGDDLPDGEYESIYGYEAMRARFTARLDATLRRIEAQAQKLLPVREQPSHASPTPEETPPS